MRYLAYTPTFLVYHFSVCPFPVLHFQRPLICHNMLQATQVKSFSTVYFSAIAQKYHERYLVAFDRGL